MEISRNAKIILERVKTAFEMRKDGDLAEFLGVAPSTLSSWKVRDSVDYEKLFTKCENINKNWLLDGEEPIWKSGYINRVNESSNPYKDVQAQLDGFIIRAIGEIEALDFDADIKRVITRKLLHISREEFGKNS